MRVLFYIPAFICWPLALVMLLTMNAVHFGGAEENAAKNRRLIQEFRPKIELVERYLAKENRLPTESELNGCTDPTILCGSFFVSNSRPMDPDFKFPPWPTNSRNYVIGYWRGEWFEYYDSASRSSSMERADEVSEWREGWWVEALIALGFAATPSLILFIGQGLKRIHDQ